MIPSLTLMPTDSERRLIDKLRMVRSDYEQETRLHRFWIDSYTGGGGFRNGRVPVPSAPFWGRDAYEYSDWSTYYGDYGVQNWSYLEAHRNEDTRDYNDRVCSSVYPNPIEPIVDLTNAFLTAEDATRENLPGLLSTWMNNVNGLGMHMRGLIKEGLRRAQVVGRVFAIVAPPADPGKNMAEAKRLGASPRVLLLWPHQIYDYDVGEDGSLTGIKFGTYQELPRKSMLDPKQTKERITIWTKDSWEFWDVLLGGDTGMGGQYQDRIIDHGEGPNELGEVPCTVLCWKTPMADNRSIAGLPQICTIATLARALYNRLSELDDHLRKANFAQLVIPGTAEDIETQTIHVGASNALIEDGESKGITRYISPPMEIAEVYEYRINAILDDIYRNALIDRGERKVAEKAEAMRMRFVQTNNILAEVAERIDAWEMSIFRLVGKILRLPDGALAQGMVRRKREYQAAALDQQIDNTLKSLQMPVGPRGAASLIKRTYRALNPDLPTAEYAGIDKEIDVLAEKKFPMPVQVAAGVTPKDDVQRLSTVGVEKEEQQYIQTWRADVPGAPGS
jgi:hypothetical protein